MKKLGNLEKELYKDIFLTILFVILSIPLWLNFGLSVSAQEAALYDNYDFVQYEFLNNASTIIYSYEDADALRKCETQDILVYNDSNTVDTYSLILKIEKNTDVNLNDLRINVNYDVDYLNNYHVYEDAKSYYYVIDSGSIVAAAQKYVISMWNTNYQASNNLHYEFIVL